MCDKAFHTFCLDPPLSAIPSGALSSFLFYSSYHAELTAGEWKCPACTQCVICRTLLSDCGPNGVGASPHTMMCVRCALACGPRRMCPVCRVGYAEETAVPMVQCDECLRWVHASCDNITSAEYQALASTIPHYSRVCVPC